MSSSMQMNAHRPSPADRRRTRVRATGAVLVALVLALSALLAGPTASPSVAAAGSDGLAVAPSSPALTQGDGSSFGLSFDDSSVSGSPFTEYLLYGLPDSGWVVTSAGAPLSPISVSPLLYMLPRAAAESGQIAVTPPAGFVGTLPGVTVARHGDGANLVTDFDNGSFDYLGTAAPQLSSATTAYSYHQPTTLVGGPSVTDCTNAQYGPCPGQYSIWPTAVLHGPARHFNNRWADLRSVSSPMTAVSSSALCQHVATPEAYYLNNSGLYPNTTVVAPAQSEDAGKFLIVNGSTVAAPNNVIFTTVSGLAPNTFYAFSGYLANLSVEDSAAPVSVQFFLQNSPSDPGTLVGTSSPLPHQEGCDTAETSWTRAASLFFSGDSTTVTIGVRNNTTGSYGNDLAIDELAMRTMASVSFDLVVTPREPGLRVEKTAVAVSGALVVPGQTISYRIVATNTGNVPLNGVAIQDDLSGVLGNADYLDGSAAATLTPGGPGPAPTLSAPTLSWTGDLPLGASVELSYRAVVHATSGLAGELRNTVTASAFDGENPVPSNCVSGTEEGCSTRHPIRDARPAILTLIKEVINDDGGALTPRDFVISADGPDDLSGLTGDAAVTGVEVGAGDYLLASEREPGYRLVAVDCYRDEAFTDPIPLEGTRLNLEPGTAAYCVLVSDDTATRVSATAASSGPAVRLLAVTGLQAMLVTFAGALILVTLGLLLLRLSPPRSRPRYRRGSVQAPSETGTDAPHSESQL